jgi:hypothetical protein
MTAPRIVRTGTLRAHGRDVEVFGPGGFALGIDAVADETEDARAMHEQSVRITIEPADATPEEAPRGSPLDYLAEMKGLMHGALDGFAISEQTERALRRCMSLANSASLAILAEKRGIK